jgi:phosphate transport system substrate-binding protein
MKTPEKPAFALASFLAAGLLLFSCSGGKKGPTDTPTQGTIQIAVDEAFLPIISAEIIAFQSLYRKARIVPRYVDEEEAFRLLLADSVRLVIGRRHFNDSEKAYFKEKRITPRSVKMATDALGIVLHKSNPDSMFTMAQVKQILTDPGFDWKKLSGKGKAGRPVLVLDKPGSSNLLTLLDRFGLGDTSALSLPVVWAGGDREVINYVNQNPSAIGFMGVNWISDPEDPTQTRFRQGIQVGFLMPDSLEALRQKYPDRVTESYYQPLQAYLAQEFYPLTRDMVVASREARSGLGTGFTAWLTSDKGQRIVLKAGLLPATMPIRLVKLKKDNDLTD